METLLEELIKNINAIIAGVPLRWEEIDKSVQREVLICALHCCLNGPVGVNKKTTFPIFGEAQINKLVKVSNSQWKGFCGGVAKYLVDRNVNVDCNALRTLGTFWPIKDWTPKAK